MVRFVAALKFIHHIVHNHITIFGEWHKHIGVHNQRRYKNLQFMLPEWLTTSPLRVSRQITPTTKYSISLSWMMSSQASGGGHDSLTRPEVSSFLVLASYLEQLQYHFLGRVFFEVWDCTFFWLGNWLPQFKEVHPQPCKRTFVHDDSKQCGQLLTHRMRIDKGLLHILAKVVPDDALEHAHVGEGQIADQEVSVGE